MLELNEQLRNTYEIRDEIGSGGGGTVYRAFHKRLQKDVVLKKIHSKLTKSKTLNTRAEADVLKNLKHEYLPQVLDYFELDGDVYTVMDFIPGQSLKQIMQDGKKIETKRIIKWFDQLCQATSQLHTQNPPIIHGDIKPDNIMITPKDDICLIDFNVSGDFIGQDVMGYTAGYAAPEQIEAFKARKSKNVKVNAQSDKDIEKTEVCDSDVTEVDDDRTEVDTSQTSPNEVIGNTTNINLINAIDVRSDIYSIGATIYSLLTGVKPDVENVVPIWNYNKKIEDSLQFIIMKCLEKNPDNRYQNISELHKAVINIHTSSKLYKQLVRRQTMTQILLAVATIAFTLLACRGHWQMNKEKNDLYAHYVSLEKEARENKDYESVEANYNKAMELFPERPDAVFEQACSLYEQKQYEKAITLIDLVEMDETTNPGVMADIYFVYGNCHFELENYEAADVALKKSISKEDGNAQAYRDDAIALARMKLIEGAENQLKKAVERGLGTPEVHYASGEILNAKGDIDGAIGEFRDCIANTNDDYLKMRSYLMCGKILGGIEKNETNTSERIKLLEEANLNLPDEYSSGIMELLAQSYIDMSEITKDSQYDEKAIQIFDEIIGWGLGTYTTYQNKAILFQKNQRYEEAGLVLNDMLTRFGEDYNIYKRLAFMEAGLQSQKTNLDRNYNKFVEYYNKSKDLYQSQLSNNKSDVEMTTLDGLYEQVVNGGWINK